LGIEAYPEKTRLRQLARNAVSFLPMNSERNSSRAPPDLSMTGVTLEPSLRLEAAPVKTSRKSFLGTSGRLDAGVGNVDGLRLGVDGEDRRCSSQEENEHYFSWSVLLPLEADADFEDS
jgi:hypothetical protein